ncbi:hypothetical protein BDW02DRAFT_495102 [Decorospora gaudefroyi]|uniref:tRNA(Phe) 7-[(3-amino-3-carboxypropyl)-4-demethylwyosine(37)-N(4)]-methyltransferase n=1 Tax=Decorospora gaudefroyi TaxID=184978 RepID=A0A6A5KCP0_9PLEO|nr:hypothetical protein BDW02DRAFT_495102 [Decorospora gaudefroyi]
MTTRFQARKQRILEQLDAPDGEYHDSSPKGSVDAPIRDFIGEINNLDGLVTTSSCSGRISVFLEGRKAEIGVAEAGPEGEESRAGPGGKGGGGAWLFISHEPVETKHASVEDGFMSIFGMKESPTDETTPNVSCRYIHLKFEPMILHILSDSMEHAQRILTAALAAGFRESGAVSLASSKIGESNPMVAVRSAGYSFDSIVGYQDGNGRNVALVDEKYLRVLVDVANERFKINADRIARFRNALLEACEPKTSSTVASAKPDWEDADARKRRKREEGLARQQALQSRPPQDSMDASGVEPIHSVFS